MAGKSSSGSAGKAKGSGQSRQHVKGSNNFYRKDDVKKIKKIKMLANGHKATRDRDGKILEAAEFQSRDAQPGMVQPDRRWFGNTRVISQDALTHFRDSLASRQADPYSVVLKQNKLPMSLLQESTKLSRPNLTTAEPFQNTFGPKAQRKRPRIEVGSFEELASRGLALARTSKPPPIMLGAEDPEDEEAAGAEAEASQVHATDLGQDEPSEAQKAMMEEESANNAPLDYILQAGTSRRIWGELYKVIDSSDIILHVLDARDPIGTRCHSVENYLAKEKRGKKVIYILNKVDLIPGWAAARWVQHLSKTHPTIAFHASINNSFGKGSLIQLLRQFSNLMSDKKQISVGFVGYPNVGKSSIINTIKAKKVCNVAPIPGETKVWQYITLMRRIYLIDCPGIVPPSSKDTETQKVLKGVVRVEHLSAPGDTIPPLLERVRPEYMTRTYGIAKWENAEDFLTQLAVKRGKLGKGGEANMDTVAKMVLNDWIRGKIPYFVRPPEPELRKASSEMVDAVTAAAAAHAETSDAKAFGEGKVAGVVQPLHQIVSRQKFIGDDQGKAVDETEWAGITGSADDEEVEVVENDLDKPDEPFSDPEANEDDDDEDEEEEEAADVTAGASELAWEDLVGDTSMSASASGSAKKRQLEQATEQDSDEEDDDPKSRRHVKEPRMKTNKKATANFFTTANVKNKNRDRKVPRDTKARSKRR